MSPMRSPIAWVLVLATCLTAQGPAEPPAGARITLGWIGQSNMQGLCDRTTMTRFALPGDAQLGAAIEYYQVDMNGFTDRRGRLAPMAFDGWSSPALRVDGYDYAPNLLPDYIGTGRDSFGPDLVASYLTSGAFGAPVTNVKLAVGNTWLTAQPPPLTSPFSHLGSYLWFGSCHSFDPTLPWGGNDDAFLATRASAGTVSSATSASAGWATLTDVRAGWQPDQWVGHWVRADGCLGYVVSNDATTLTVPLWAPTWRSRPRVGTSYSIEHRERREVSLARSFVEGYCERTKELLAARGEQMDLRVIGVQIGENEALRYGDAIRAEARMTSLIRWLRDELDRRRMTTVPRERVGVVLGLIKDQVPWTYASIVNSAYRAVAAADPFVEVSPVVDVELGGRHPVPGSPYYDRLHYSADGQVENGVSFAEQVVKLIHRQ